MVMMRSSTGTSLRIAFTNVVLPELVPLDSRIE